MRLSPRLRLSPIYDNFQFVKLKVRNIHIFYLLVTLYFSLSTSSILKATHRVTVPAEAAAHVGIAAGEAQEPGGGTIHWIIGTWIMDYRDRRKIIFSSSSRSFFHGYYPSNKDLYFSFILHASVPCFYMRLSPIFWAANA